MTTFRSEVRMYSLMYDTKNGTNVTVVTDGEVARACELEDVIFGKKNGRYRSWHEYSAMAIICKDKSTAPLADGKTLYTAIHEWLSNEMEKTLLDLSAATVPKCAERLEMRRKRLAIVLRAWNFEPPIKEGKQ